MKFQKMTIWPYLDRILGVRAVVVRDLDEEVLAEAGDDALVVPLPLPHHGVALPRSRLPVRDNAHVVSCGSEAY